MRREKFQIPQQKGGEGAPQRAPELPGVSPQSHSRPGAAPVPSERRPGRGGQRGRGVGAAVHVVEGLQGALGAAADVGQLHRGPGRAKRHCSTFGFITQLLFSSKKKPNQPKFLRVLVKRWELQPLEGGSTPYLPPWAGLKPDPEVDLGGSWGKIQAGFSPWSPNPWLEPPWDSGTTEQNL